VAVENGSVCLPVHVCLQEFDTHMSSDGHAANMNVMSAVYHDKNKQLLTSSFETMTKKSSAGAGR